MNALTYKKAGVDVALGDECSKILYEASRKTWQNRSDRLGKIVSEMSGFGTLRYVQVPQDPELTFGMNSDGVGTKIELAERLGDHRTIAFDLFAMVCDDAAIAGAEPILMTSVIDFRKIDIKIVRQIAEGMVNAAAQSSVCVINGEIAELGNRVGGYTEASYNWSATILWAAKKSRLYRPNIIKPGVKILAIKEEGIRSNGLSLIRKLMEKNYGYDWHKHSECLEILKWALLPSRIYTPLLVKINGGYADSSGYAIIAAVHVTGGGIPGKLGRLLGQWKVGARLENLFEPHQRLIDLQNIGSLTDEECYKTWNMGQGLLILCDDSSAIEELASKMGYKTRIVGVITEQPEIIIRSKAAKSHGDLLTFKI